jgi:hypothetical protein
VPAAESWSENHAFFMGGADPVVSSAMSVLDEEMWLKKCGIGQQARIDRTRWLRNADDCRAPKK